MTTDFATFAKLDQTKTPAHGPHWYKVTADTQEPAIWLNTSSSSHAGVLPGHPGLGNLPVVLRWTAPTSGMYNLVGKFFPGDPGTMQVGIRRGSKWLWQATDAGRFHLTVSVQAGDTIDFVVHGGYGSGTTPLAVDLVMVNPLAS